LNLELRHHQYAELNVIIFLFFELFECKGTIFRGYNQIFCHFFIPLNKFLPFENEKKNYFSFYILLTYS